MRVVLFANNRVAAEITEWLSDERADQIVGLVLHPPGKRKCMDRILAATGIPEEHVIDGSRLKADAVREELARKQADIGVSLFFDYILSGDMLRTFPRGVVNLHPSYLPFNRGQYPNVWSIIEGTPAGVTLHYMDDGVDTGDIISQVRVSVEPVDTGETLYRKLERAAINVFKDTWPRLRDRTAPRIPQQPDAGTYHRTRDVDSIDEINLDGTYTARELIDIIRARTFPPYPGTYFRVNDRKVYLRLTLLDEREMMETTHEQRNPD